MTQNTERAGESSPGSGAGTDLDRPRRTATVSRTTRESSVELTLDIDGTGQVDVSTSVPFFDHMLTALGTHARFDLTVRATGDTHIDAHHTVEDIAIVLGQALREALGDKRGIARFGDAMVPLDEALAQAVVDLSGRPYCVHTGESEAQALHLIGGHFTGSLTRHVFESIAHHAAICLHIRLLAGRDPHHVVEAQFKALARALRAACALDDRVLDVPSTKGAL
ncbi:imidazoleglycerol-phosphate dehydratase HisB [Brachybacterium sp. p3-SID1565]|uniref:imidazoleglycerol-phosphate dehydratase HisB n=1 Tax=Brachybacterium sp. p3-SID1565 TaxID=2916046 RepID=UPI0021A66D56|nr:imidazoleglycerol-phosphate dehydratase HisB [Brachybacterium sp. p3-SID1565]MCT1386016.1 imidazoleglycerol-phosphate dehydratase HisB [Brachybacterium sp. p3-SID1565]